MKKVLVALIILLTVAAYAVGNYFVDYALKRGADLSPPEACMKIADPSLKEPPAPNFPSEDLTLTSFDGITLHAEKFTPAEKSGCWAILVHGYGRDGRFAYDYAEEYLKRGWNVLIPDLRAQGRSDGEYITMGKFESRDVYDWAQKISSEYPDAKIILHGVSMGGATVIMAGALNPDNLVAVIEDCGFTSAYEMFTAQIEKIFGLPEFPIMPCADFVCGMKTGTKISEAAPIEFVDKIKVPVLFIHGDADTLIPIEMMERLSEACTAPKEIFVVNGAGHADSKVKNPTAYFEKIFTFLTEVMQ
ncbi:MAG: alpha/beta hydrolase [Selenomonadaceae bacterium]|nr:alpha/beta hydrolase [Selenomonadaceae bacterium]